MCLVAVLAGGTLAQPIATNKPARTCTKSPRLVFDPPGVRHSLPQLTWDGTGYTVIGYDGPPTSLHQTRFDFGKRKPVFASLGMGGIPATATNGSEVAIAFIAATRVRSFLQIIDRNGKPVVRPLALGDQKVQHDAPGVQVAWNPQAKEWGVLWSESATLKFARVSTLGNPGGTFEVAKGAFISPNGRMVWTGSGFAFAARTQTGLDVLEVGANGVRATTLLSTLDFSEPAVAAIDGTLAVVYRTYQDAPVRGGGRPAPPPADLQNGPPAHVVNPQLHKIELVTVKDGKASAPVTLKESVGLGLLSTPALAVDGNQLVVVWPERQSKHGFDDRLVVARTDLAGTMAPGYPKRLDAEDVHQGYASLAGTGCDLAISYILGDPNGAVRVAVQRAP